MKLLPVLPPLQAPNNMERLSLFNPSDLLWRYPLNFHSPAPTYPQMDFKTHLPASLAGDPRLWSREDVVAFLRWSEYEFDLPPFDLEMFQMNGKALCLLTKADLGERSPGSGDVLHNVLQMLIRDSSSRNSAALPNSPLTPHFPLTPSWSFSSAPALEFPSTPTAPQLSNSVTLSPAPSVDSQAGSPRQPDGTATTTAYPALNNYSNSSQSNGGASSGSNQSDSEVEEPAAAAAAAAAPRQPVPPPPTTTTMTAPYPQSPPPHSPLSVKNVGHSFFPSEPSTEPNTNGRLLWDFLQQLLNDSMQRYTAYIAWKNRDLGVFKIVDPPGLAKLWGIQKNHLSMNYDKMSRALRYYYRVNILRKVQGERHCYQFLRNPSELKSIKNISLLRQQMNSSSTNNSSSDMVHIKSEPAEAAEEEMRPTDLSMGQHFRLSNDVEYIRNSNENKTAKAMPVIQHPINNTASTPSEIKCERTETSEEDLRPVDSGLSQHYLRLGAEKESQPRDLSLGGPMQIQLNMRTRENFAMPEDFSRPEDLSVPTSHLQVIKTEEKS